MFCDGLIYRANRIVNWDVTLGTTLSDIEIYKNDDPNAALYRIQYGPLEVSTHRPEMRLGDTALAVHPADQRYSKFIGREIKGSWPSRPMVRLRVSPDKAA